MPKIIGLRFLYLPSVFFAIILLLHSSCSQNNSKTEQKSDTLLPPQIVVLKNLADSCKPLKTFLNDRLKPQTALLPDTNVFDLLKTVGDKKISINPPTNIPAIAPTTSFTNYNNEQRYALTNIECSLKDKKGNLWFGTKGGGVSRYDGKFFTTFTISQGLADNRVTCIMEDIKGNLWFGTHGNGASCYDGKFFTTYSIKNGLVHNDIKKILEDKTGNIWFATAAGVSRYDGNRVEAIEESLKRGEIISQQAQQNLTRKNGKLVKSFTNYTTQQGLADNKVVCMAADKQGKLWIGTEGMGASYYDGKTFRIYRQGKLLNHRIHNILVDKSGNIWFTIFNPNDYTRDVLCYSPPPYTPTDTGKINEKYFTSYNTQAGFQHEITDITEDKKGNFWFSTLDAGAVRYTPSSTGKPEDGRFTSFNASQGLSNNTITCITEDNSGNLWFGTDGNGLSRYDGESLAAWGFGQIITKYVIRCVLEDRYGNLWFGTSGMGAICYNGKSFTNYNVAQGLVHNNVFSIMEDSKGCLWFGTMGGGISRYDGNMVDAIERGEIIPQEIQQNLKKVNGKFVKSFTNYTTVQGLVNNNIRSIKEDAKGNIWFGTNGGVSRYTPSFVHPNKNNGKNEHFTNFTIKQGLAADKVRSIIEDKVGNIWISTYEGGVSKYDGKSFTNYTTAQGLAHNVVFSILEDKGGNLWFGTNGGGVSRYDGDSFTTYSSANGLADDVVYAMVESVKKSYTVKDIEENSLVIGTNLGLSILSGWKAKDGKIVPFENLENATNEDLKNYTPVWEIYNNKTGYPIKDLNTNAMCVTKIGFPASRGKVREGKGMIWGACGDNKIIRFDPSLVNRDSEPPTVVIQNVKIQEEDICWYSLQASPVDENAAKKEFGDKQKTDSTAKSQQEVMTFGKLLSNEERDRMKQKFRNIQFDSITKWYPLPVNLILPYKHNSITFDFAAIEPSRPYLVKYQYILEGYDKDWSYGSNKTSATFGNIYEGTYTFKLKACSPSGIWSEPVSYSFKVLPPWWRTWWMYTIFGICLLSLIAAFIKWRERNLKREKVVLEQKVELRTQQLDERNKVVEEQKKVVEEQKKVVEEKHKEITDSINYAERIQRSLLASKELLDENLKEYFVFFQPKDVVSGDFYWASKLLNDQFALVTADSTGHGVPGAIMSILNISCLEKAVDAQKLVEPSDILGHTRKKIIETLKKDGSAQGGKDGMDCSLVCFDFENGTLTCAAANNPVWIVRDKQIIVFAPDKMPVGKHENDATPFTQQTFDLKKGDVVYTLTDGMPDQFGGPNGKKFMSKQLKELLISISDLPMDQQKEKLNYTLNKWKGNLEQVDDICIIGVRI